MTTPAMAASRVYTGYDDVTLSAIPSNAEVVAGYVGGMWPTYDAVVRDFPHAAHVSIAINASELTHNGRPIDCLDVEPGDATISQARGWDEAEIRLGEKHPCDYTSLSQMGALEAAVRGLPALFWMAAYDGNPSLMGFDAHQWTDHALGRSLDADTFSEKFLLDLGLIKPKPSNLVSKATMAKWKGAEAATLRALDAGCVRVGVDSKGQAAASFVSSSHCDTLRHRAEWFERQIRKHRVR